MVHLRGMSPTTFAQALLQGLRPVRPVSHLFLCVADHYEPDWHGATPQIQKARVERWVKEYPRLFAGLQDSRNRTPQHTFFYPAEVYSESHLEQLQHLVARGFGEVEVHLHHDDDNAERLTRFLLEYCQMIHQRHGFLRKSSLGQLAYGFIHGNWALDNSHPEHRWCGVNNEIDVLRSTGCYADFTMPAAPHAAQTKTINAIYYAIDDPLQPKSHDTGIAARVGAEPPSSGLLMIQGPLVVGLRIAKGKLPIQVENGNLSRSQPPASSRLRNWIRASVSVRGREDWRFIKLHTHGAPEENADVLLGEPMLEMHRGLQAWSGQTGSKFYYVTAREMAMLVHQAEQGITAPDFESLGI